MDFNRAAMCWASRRAITYRNINMNTDILLYVKMWSDLGIMEPQHLMLLMSPLGDHFGGSGIMVKKWFWGDQKHKPKKYAKNGRRDNGARAQALAQGAIPGPGPGPLRLGPGPRLGPHCPGDNFLNTF